MPIVFPGDPLCSPVKIKNVALFPDMFPGHSLAVNVLPCMPLFYKILIYQ